MVRDPVTRKLLPAAGAEVPNTSFWRRRVRDADVIDPKAADALPANDAKAAAADALPAESQPQAGES